MVNQRRKGEDCIWLSVINVIVFVEYVKFDFKDPFIRNEIIGGDNEKRKQYMVPQSVFNKLIEKQPNTNTSKNNTNEKNVPRTDYYFNEFIEHVRTDDIDFSKL